MRNRFTPLLQKMLAPGRGFEPRLADPESAVLPLDDPGSCRAHMRHSTGMIPYQPAQVQEERLNRTVTRSRLPEERRIEEAAQVWKDVIGLTGM